MTITPASQRVRALCLTVLVLLTYGSALHADITTNFAVQLKLEKLGFDVGKADGKIGPKSRAALTDAAQSHGFAPSPSAMYTFYTRKTRAGSSPVNDDKTSTYVKEAVGEYLKDPFSAQYRNLNRLPSGTICGEVNAKNSYGAYTGWSTFRVSKPIEISGKLMGGFALLGGPKAPLVVAYCDLDM